MMRLRACGAMVLLLLSLAACSSTETIDQTSYQGPHLPPPGRILVYDFTADPNQVPPESGFDATGALARNPATPQERQMTAALGADVARRIVAALREAGLPAVPAAGMPAPILNDVVIRGYFVSADAGSGMKRLVVGFGSGNAELTTAVEGFVMTANGIRLLGGATVASGGNKVPGLVLPAAVMAATANPVGLAVGGTMKLADEATGNAGLDGVAKRTADHISKQLIAAAQRQGWL